MLISAVIRIALLFLQSLAFLKRNFSRTYRDKDKYIFKEYFQESECDNNIHNKLIQKVQKKEFDILISAFYYDSYRITKNNYSLPLFVTPIKIIYPKNVNFNNAIEQFKDLCYSLFYPILFAFILCIILSFLLIGCITNDENSKTNSNIELKSKMDSVSYSLGYMYAQQLKAGYQQMEVQEPEINIDIVEDVF